MNPEDSLVEWMRDVQTRLVRVEHRREIAGPSAYGITTYNPGDLITVATVEAVRENGDHNAVYMTLEDDRMWRWNGAEWTDRDEDDEVLTLAKFRRRR
jgi:hypothetical protein